MSHELKFPVSEDQFQRISFRGSSSEDQVQIAQIRRLSSEVVPGEGEPGTLPPDGRCYAEELDAVPIIKDQTNTDRQSARVNKYRSLQFVGLKPSLPTANAAA
jgi:hypothetical protein